MENKIWELINNSQKILILTHERPDGDAVGSSLAMSEALTNLGKNVTVVMHKVPKTYAFLNGYQSIVPSTNDEFDLGIVLDCSTRERIGQLTDLTTNCQHLVCLDHHVINSGYADINYIEHTASSCCQIVYYFLKQFNQPITKPIGEAILVGILTDTSGFANSNVDAKTFELTTHLVNQGIDFYQIYSQVLRFKTKTQFLLQQIATSRLEFYESEKIAFTYLTKEDLLNNNAEAGDHEGIVDIGRNISGVEVSVFIREDDGYHVSLRSNGQINVNEIAQKFNGGGHIMAAGCIINKPFKETKELLLNEIKKKLG